MARLARSLAALLCFLPGMLLAQDAPGGDIKILRQMIEQQSRQLDVLAQEIARLNLLLETKGTIPPGPAQAPDAAGDAAIPKAVPADVADAGVAPAGAAGPVHVVTKGETLTSIARRYKVTVTELLKVNKIADVRRLQIGQTVVLPPGARMPASPTPQP